MEEQPSPKEKTSGFTYDNLVKFIAENQKTKAAEDKKAEEILSKLGARNSSDKKSQMKKDNPIYRMAQKMMKSKKNSLQHFSLALLRTLLWKKRVEKEPPLQNNINNNNIQTDNKKETFLKKGFRKAAFKMLYVKLKRSKEEIKTNITKDRIKKQKEHYKKADLHIYIKEHQKPISLKFKSLLRIKELVNETVPLIYSPILNSNLLLLDIDNNKIDDRLETNRFYDDKTSTNLFGINNIKNIPFRLMEMSYMDIHNYKILLKQIKQPLITLPKLPCSCDSELIKPIDFSNSKLPSEITCSFNAEPDLPVPDYNKLTSMVDTFNKVNYKTHSNIELNENSNTLCLVNDINLDIEEEIEEEEEIENDEEEIAIPNEQQQQDSHVQDKQNNNTKNENVNIKEDNNIECESIGGFNTNTNIDVITADNNIIINEVKQNLTSFNYDKSNIKHLYDFVLNVLQTLKAKYKEFDNEYTSISKNKQQIQTYIESLRRNINMEQKEKRNNVQLIIENIISILSETLESLTDKQNSFQRTKIEKNVKQEKDINEIKALINKTKKELELQGEEIKNKEQIINSKNELLNQKNNVYEMQEKRMHLIHSVIEHINNDSTQFQNNLEMLNKLNKEKQNIEPMISYEKKNEIKKQFINKEKEKIMNKYDSQIKHLTANNKLYEKKIKDIKHQISTFINQNKIQIEHNKPTSATLHKSNIALCLFVILLLIILFINNYTRQQHN